MKLVHSVSFAVFYDDYFCSEFCSLTKVEQFIKDAYENNPDMKDGYSVRVKGSAVIRYSHRGNNIYAE